MSEWPSVSGCPSLVSSGVRRASLTAASLVSLTLLLAACSSTPQPTAIPNLSIGVSLHEAQKFFNGMGGGGWKVGSITGGVIGYASGDGRVYHCVVQLGGRAVALNRVT